MNIFVLSTQPVEAAKFHCDKHIVKMPLETAQMLCAVYDRYGEEAPYKATHANHPCTVWAGQSIENYKWLWNLGRALCDEYTYRYRKIHACAEVLTLVKCPPVGLTSRGFTKFAQAMPDEYKHRDTVFAYHNYYRGAKSDIAVWTKREVPWFMEKQHEIK